MRGKFTGLLLTMCVALPTHAEFEPVSVMAIPLGVTQEGVISPSSLTKRPKFVICGGSILCAEPSIKTVDNRVEQPVLVAQAAPAVQMPAVVEVHNEDADKAAKEAFAEPATIDVTVHFAFSSSALNKDAKTILAKLVMDQHHEGQTIRILGYTDAVGDQKINDRLARKRALTVKTYLVGAGVDPALVQIGSVKGKCCYTESNSTKAGRAANRRAEVKSSSISVSIKE